ncbi:MAG: hypothetical protein ACRD88_22350 [Terriglobia bacterium]
MRGEGKGLTKRKEEFLSPLPGLDCHRLFSHGCRRGPQDSAPAGADSPAILVNNPAYALGHILPSR